MFVRAGGAETEAWHAAPAEPEHVRSVRALRRGGAGDRAQRLPF